MKYREFEVLEESDFDNDYIVISQVKTDGINSYKHFITIEKHQLPQLLNALIPKIK